MIALYTTWYNFARVNSAVRMFPATAARLTERLWDIGDIVNLIEEWENKVVQVA
jgi:signal recognition particle GTPase